MDFYSTPMHILETAGTFWTSFVCRLGKLLCDDDDDDDQIIFEWKKVS